MASIIDSFNDALNEDKSYLKIALYAIPVFISAQLFLVGRMASFWFFTSIFGVLFFGLLTQGINNVRLSKREVLSINPIAIVGAILKGLAVVVPYALVFGFIGYFISTKVSLPIDLPHVQLIFAIVVWSIVFSLVMTAYLSFAKYLKIVQGYNFKVIFDSCVDVFLALLFFVPQFLIAVAVLVGPVWYLFTLFHVPLNHWGFVAYCSAAFVASVSMMANYFAQIAYEQIKGNNEDYDENCQLNVIDDIAERMNGH